MKQHKWYNEIVAWASGAEIQKKIWNGKDKDCTVWVDDKYPIWHINEFVEYRIKPKPRPNLCKHGVEIGKCTSGEPDCKKPQYLNLYGWIENGNISFYKRGDSPYIGKIKLEDEE